MAEVPEIVDRMLAEIEAELRRAGRHVDRSRFDPRVLAAIGRVRRDAFVPEDLRPHAWENRPLPIGLGQTISQPFIVAFMTDLLAPEPDHRVLEIGTGSGYQAAVLAELVAAVHTIEIVDDLAERARHVLGSLGHANVRYRVGDGYGGWPEAAPFDGILVAATCPRVPPALVEQLRPGGRLVLPLRTKNRGEELTLVEKRSNGEVVVRDVLPVRFVPLTGPSGLESGA